MGIASDFLEGAIRGYEVQSERFRQTAIQQDEKENVALGARETALRLIDPTYRDLVNFARPLPAATFFDNLRQRNGFPPGFDFTV